MNVFYIQFTIYSNYHVTQCQTAHSYRLYLLLLIYTKVTANHRNLLPSGTKTKVTEEEQSSNLNYKNFSFYFQI